LRAQVAKATDETLARLPQHTTPVVPALDIATGAPAEEILKSVDRTGADLVVMGTRGLGRASKLVFGSTAERVLRSATVPVLLIPEYAPERMSVELGVTRFSVHDVVAAVGFDATDRAVVAAAGAWARECGAALTLLHVSPDVPAPSWWPFAAPQAPVEQLDTAMAQLQDLAGAGDDTAPATLEVRQGAVDVEIASLAAERESGLIVISRGGGAHRLGATAYRVVASAGVPTLVVPGATRDQ
jgi:nucleotide-binding universal stress UspA family protein